MPAIAAATLCTAAAPTWWPGYQTLGRAQASCYTPLYC